MVTLNTYEIKRVLTQEGLGNHEKLEALVKYNPLLFSVDEFRGSGWESKRIRPHQKQNVKEALAGILAKEKGISTSLTAYLIDEAANSLLYKSKKNDELNIMKLNELSDTISQYINKNSVYNENLSKRENLVQNIKKLNDIVNEGQGRIKEALNGGAQQGMKVDSQEIADYLSQISVIKSDLTDYLFNKYKDKTNMKDIQEQVDSKMGETLFSNRAFTNDYLNKADLVVDFIDGELDKYLNNKYKNNTYKLPMPSVKGK